MTASSSGKSLLVPTGDIGPLVKLGDELQKNASKYNIHNVFDDGGYKELLLLTLFGLKKLGRTGDDAADGNGNQYEIKTVARMSSSGSRKSSLSVTTEHTLTLENIRRYRSVHLWIVAVFNQAQPEEIFEITPMALEPKFKKWEERLIEQKNNWVEGGAQPHLNNPKIPLNFIKEHGVRVWPESELKLPLDVKEGLEEAEGLG
ncbi:hypothetical protein AB0M72_21310 [Nocardiopsis dassonvillei]